MVITYRNLIKKRCSCWYCRKENTIYHSLLNNVVQIIHKNIAQLKLESSFDKRKWNLSCCTNFNLSVWHYFTRFQWCFARLSLLWQLKKVKYVVYRIRLVQDFKFSLSTQAQLLFPLSFRSSGSLSSRYESCRLRSSPRLMVSSSHTDLHVLGSIAHL